MFVAAESATAAAVTHGLYITRARRIPAATTLEFAFPSPDSAPTTFCDSRKIPGELFVSLLSIAAYVGGAWYCVMMTRTGGCLMIVVQTMGPQNIIYFAQYLLNIVMM